MPGRPGWAFGYVDALVFLVMLPGVIYATLRGVAIATRPDKQILQRVYSLFLLVIIATMIGHSAMKS